MPSLTRTVDGCEIDVEEVCDVEVDCVEVDGEIDIDDETFV